MFEKQTKVSVSTSQQGFDYWINRPYISDARREKLKRATLLFVPYETIENSRGPLFSSTTRSLLDFFTDQHSDLVPDVAINEEDYAELVLHGKLLNLGKVVVAIAVVPIAMNLVSNYVQRMIDGDGHDTVRFEMTVARADGTSSSIKYDGPASTFEKVFAERVRKISNDVIQTASDEAESNNSRELEPLHQIKDAKPNAPEPRRDRPPSKQDAIDDSKRIPIVNRSKNGKKRAR